MAERNARWGLWLFFIYTFFYALFVVINAVAPEVMEWTPLAGVNLAILSGFGLILLAFLLALLYGVIAKNEESGDAS